LHVLGFGSVWPLDVLGNVPQDVPAACCKLERGIQPYERGALVLGADMVAHGLSTDEVQRLLAETSQQTIPRPIAELVHRQTEGNPLFVRETLRFGIVIAHRSGRTSYEANSAALVGSSIDASRATSKPIRTCGTSAGDSC
jgi:hypothetical protein